jgi:radical SAM protein
MPNPAVVSSQIWACPNHGLPKGQGWDECAFGFPSFITGPGHGPWGRLFTTSVPLNKGDGNGNEPCGHGGIAEMSKFESKPLLVFWETTRACPLSCVHCRASSVTHRSKEELSTGEAKFLLNQVAAFGSPPPVFVFTGGDPLMRNDLDELMVYARSKGLRTAVSPAVGPSLTVRRLRELADAGATSISLSLDGSTEAIHDEIRGVAGTYHRTVELVNEALKLGINLQVNSVVMSKNAWDFPALFHLIRQMGVRVWEVFFIVETGRAPTRLGLTAQEFEDVASLVVDLSAYTDQVIRVVEAPFVRRILRERQLGLVRTGTLYAELLSETKRLEGSSTGVPSVSPTGTLDGDGVVFVRDNGDIFPGGMLPVRLGNIKDHSLVEIYRNHWLLKQIRSRNYFGVCGRCQFKYVCGGSRARAYSSTGSPLSSDPACLYGALSCVSL